MSAMGVKSDLFDAPVCNSFEAKVLNDQICYEVDLNKFSDRRNIERELKLGLNFLMDYNEDRQVTFQRNYSKKIDGVNWADSIVESDQLQHAIMYVETIGKSLLN